MAHLVVSTYVRQELPTPSVEISEVSRESRYLERINFIAGEDIVQTEVAQVVVGVLIDTIFPPILRTQLSQSRHLELRQTKNIRSRKGIRILQTSLRTRSGDQRPESIQGRAARHPAPVEPSKPYERPLAEAR